MIHPPLVGKNEDLISLYWKGKAKEVKTESPTEAFKKYCEDTPWMPECKIYET